MPARFITRLTSDESKHSAKTAGTSGNAHAATDAAAVGAFQFHGNRSVIRRTG